MEINTQSSNAQDRTLSVWFHKINNGEIKLPRFQRFQAWDRKRIVSLLETVTYNLPLGVTLLLNVGDEEKFVSRYLYSAPKTGNKVNEHLLDGQQRLTAIWRCMHNNYENETYFIYIPEFDIEDDNISSDDMMAYCQTRWTKRENRYPLWADDPKTCFKKGLIPINLIRPMDIKTEIDDWVNDAVIDLMPDKKDGQFAQKFEAFFNKKSKLEKKITELRERVTYYNLPYLALPGTTPKDVALRVFINMNTNTKPLSIYDVIVAEIESVKGVSLHDLQKSLDEKYPKVANYFSLEQLILATSALLQDRMPNNAGMLEMKKHKIVDNWKILVNGLNKMSVFLENEGIYNRQLLPTNAVLGVIAALYSVIPVSGDKLGKAEILLRKYLWSSFFTDRYENSAATRAFRDYVTLKKILLAGENEAIEDSDVPALNRLLHPIADNEELVLVGWPKRENIRARGIMCVASRLGALDFSDGSKLNILNINSRDYHHIFPKSLLENLGVESDLALNCAIISSSTNKNLGAKSPLTYIKEKYEIFDDDTIKFRLKSHLIPLARLSEMEDDQTDDENYIKRLYQEYLKERAGLIREAAEQLCEGKEITADTVLSKNIEIPADLRELNDEITRIELATRELIYKRITSEINYSNILEIIPQKIFGAAKDKYESWHKKNPGAFKEEPLSLKTVLKNITLSEYKDIIVSKKHWFLFQEVFKTHGNVMNRYTQLGTMRNKIRHANELTLVERKDGEAAIEWFNKALIEYLN